MNIRVRNPRPFYEQNYLLKTYKPLHANWYHIIPQISKDIKLPTFYDLVCIPDEYTTVENFNRNAKVVSHKCHLLAISKYFLIHLVNIVKLGKANVSISKEFAQKHEEPNMVEKISTKDGTGSKIIVEGIFSLRNMQFIEHCDESAVLLGFNVDQSENLTKEIYKSEVVAKIHMNEDGYNTKYGIASEH